MNTLVKTDWFPTTARADFLLFYCFTAIFFTMPLGTALPTFFSVLAGIIWVISGKIRCVKHFWNMSWFFPVMLLIVLPWIGLIYTPDVEGLGLNYAKKTHYWIYGLALASVSFHVIHLEKWIQGFLMGLAGNAIVGFCQLIGIVPPIEGWYSGVGRGYSTLSAYLIIGILTASFYFKIAETKKIRILAASLMGLFFFHLVILKGRTGYLTFLVLSPLILINCFKKFSFPKFIICCVGLMGLMSLSPIVRERVAKSVSDIHYHMSVDESQAWGKVYTDKQDRFFMWYQAVHIFLENPLIGVGTGGYQTEVQRRVSPDVPTIAHPHNDFLYMAVSYGVIGIVAFFWLFGEIIKNAWRYREVVTGYFVFVSALVILVSGLFNGQTIDAGMALLLSLIVGLQQSFPQFQSNIK